MSKTQAPDPAPRPFTAVKAFADSVLAMLDERIKAVDQAAHPFNDYFGDQPETIVAAKAQASELREVRTQVRMLGDRALVDLMKFRPAIPAPEGAQAARSHSYLAGHADGLEWAACLVAQDDPRTGDWMYDDRYDLAAAIRKGPEMPDAEPLCDDQATWCGYVAGMVAAYLDIDSEDERVPVMAKVIERRLWALPPRAAQSPAEGDGMLEPLVYAAMMHSGTPKTVAEFERAAANVAGMLERRAEVTHNKPVASIYISDDGSREFDDWRVDLPPGNHQLFTAPRPAQPQPESLPHPGAPEAEEMIDKLLAEYNRPANMKNAARAGYMAARRLLQNARQPLPAVEDAEPIGWGGVIETCAELCDPHFIAQQDLDELKRYAGNWNSTYRFFPIYAPGAQLTEGPAVLAERDALKAAIVELNAAEFAYARYIRSDGLEKHRQNRERRIAAWQAARKLVGADGSNVPVQHNGDANG